MTPEEAKEFVENQNKNLLEKGVLILEVKLNTVEDAQQIMEWMYAEEKPMSSVLASVSWDQKLVSTKVFDAVQTIIEEGR